MVKSVRTRTECAIGDEQYIFRQGRGCKDQVYVVRQVCEKSREWERCILGVMDLENGYDMIDRYYIIYGRCLI